MTYYEYSEKDSLNVTVYKKVKQLSLHYFESFFDNKNVLINSTYTIFDMTDDFIEMMMKCEEIIPHAKNHLVNRITKFKEKKEAVGSKVKPSEALQTILDDANLVFKRKSLDLKTRV